MDELAHICLMFGDSPAGHFITKQILRDSSISSGRIEFQEVLKTVEEWIDGRELHVFSTSWYLADLL